MDYTELAKQFINISYQFARDQRQQIIDEATHGESFVLIILSQKSGSVLPSEISSEMSISSARVAAALNSLENKGLITRQIDKSDRRKILVDLTPAGRTLAQERVQAIIHEATQILMMLGEEDAKELVRILGKLIGHSLINGAERKGIMH